MAFSVFAAIAAAFAAAIVAFLMFGTYTKRSNVTGQLVPSSGLVKVYVPQSGVVREKHVTEGQTVKRGEALYVLSSERRSMQGDTQAAISGQVEIRRQSLRNELDKTLQLQQEERNALIRKIDARQSEADKLGSQIEAQQARTRLAEDTLARYRELLAQNYISRETLQQKQAESLDQQLRLQSLERERIGTVRELAAHQSELASLPLRHQNQLAQIERSIMMAGQELTESEARRNLVVTAPENGIATAVLADIGQTVDPGKPLLSIVPEGAKLMAHLYAPSRSVGFVKPGDTVLVRYHAYPYQKFGHAQGTVTSVSRTALPSNEVATLMSSQATAGAEPLYRITVDLAAQTVSAYGKPQSLQAGMLLEADVLQERRRLYEWVLEPLYSLTGKL